jgi:hypothetical protein
MICRPKMTKEKIQYILASLGRTMALRAHGRRGFYGIAGSGTSRGRLCRGLEGGGEMWQCSISKLCLRSKVNLEFHKYTNG